MAPVRNIFRSPVVAGLLIGILSFIIVSGLRIARTLEPFELYAYDYLLQLCASASYTDNRITLITITEEDIQQLGQWPLTDHIMAQMLSRIIKYNPRGIGLDIYRDIPVPPGGDELNTVFKENSKIVAPMKFGGVKGFSVAPPPVLANTDQIGFTDMVVDPGGIVRRGILFMDDGKTVFYSLALRISLLYLYKEGIVPQPDPVHTEFLRIGKTTIKPLEANDGGYVGVDSRGYQFLLDYKGATSGFTSYTLSQLLADKIPSESLNAKTVLIGMTAESVKDFFYTPFSLGIQKDRPMPGIELHGHIVSQLLRFALDGDSLISTLNEKMEYLIILIGGFIGGLLFLTVRSARRFFLMASTGLVLIGVTAYWALLNAFWIPVIPPALSFLIASSLVTAYVLNREKKERMQLMTLFSKHVSEEVAEAIWQQRHQFIEAGRPRPQKLIASVLFTDLVGFTTLSENMEPHLLMGWLNEYMDAMVDEIMAYGGIINKYVGDAIMAIFGVPLPRATESAKSEDALNAVQCALAMEKRLATLNKIWRERGLSPIAMRIGIYTGELVAGSLGSARRLEYTVIGDTVNTAARLESYDKESFIPDYENRPCRILIGESTLHYVPDSFLYTEVGKVKLKGKDKEITVFQIIGRKDEMH